MFVNVQQKEKETRTTKKAKGKLSHISSELVDHPKLYTKSIQLKTFRHHIVLTVFLFVIAGDTNRTLESPSRSPQKKQRNMSSSVRVRTQKVVKDKKRSASRRDCEIITQEKEKEKEKEKALNEKKEKEKKKKKVKRKDKKNAAVSPKPPKKTPKKDKKVI